MNHKSGFTLMEILIVIGLMAMLTGLLAGKIGIVDDVDRSTSITNLTRTIKMAYNQAVINKVTHRIVFDLIQGRYWLESGNKSTLLSTEKVDAELFGNTAEAADKDQQAELERLEELYARKDTVTDDKGNNREISYTSPLLRLKRAQLNPSFRKVKTRDIKNLKLAQDLYFADIQAEHNTEKIERPKYIDRGDELTSIAYLYFLPSGYVEHAVIHINEFVEDGEQGASYTIITDPLTAATRFYAEYKEVSLDAHKSEE